MVKTIGNPLSWITHTFGRGSRYVESGTKELLAEDTSAIVTRRLKMSDLKEALQMGTEDFLAFRTDVIFVVLIYPIAGFLLAWFAFNRDLLPLLFPLVSGFALLGPFAAVGLYEMSRRRELGLKTSWADAFGIVESPSFVPILVLGGYLVGLFFTWMVVAFFLYQLTLGPEPPASMSAFVSDVLTTEAGWTMSIVGILIGFVFAALVLAISVVSFPLLVDRHVGVAKAVIASVEVAQKNPVVIAAWGLIVVALLGLGVITLFVGLVFVLPILGHSTWHLYRRAVVRRDEAEQQPDAQQA